MTILRRLALLALFPLLLTGCQVRSWLTLDLSGGSSGTVTAEVGFDQEFRDAIEQFGGGADLLAEIEDDAPGEGWTVERFTDDDLEGVRLSKTFASIDELEGILASGIGAGPQEGLVQELSVIDRDDTVRFEASLPGLGDIPAGGMDIPELEGMLQVDGRIQVTFPGEVIDHNGELEGRTVTWTFDTLQSNATEMFAEARKGGGFPWVAIIAVLLGLGVIGLVTWRVLSDKNVRFKLVSPLQRLDQPKEPVAAPAPVPGVDLPEPTNQPPTTPKRRPKQDG